SRACLGGPFGPAAGWWAWTGFLSAFASCRVSSEPCSFEPRCAPASNTASITCQALSSWLRKPSDPRSRACCPLLGAKHWCCPGGIVPVAVGGVPRCPYDACVGAQGAPSRTAYG